jgi:prophage tail gpP-like protein
VRAGRAATATIPVQGWRQGDGSLWPVNALVDVHSPRLGLGGQMLITQATYSIDDSGGTTTSLSLKPPRAFLPEPQLGKDVLWKELSKVPKK